MPILASRRSAVSKYVARSWRCSSGCTAPPSGRVGDRSGSSNMPWTVYFSSSSRTDPTLRSRARTSSDSPFEGPRQQRRLEVGERLLRCGDAPYPGAVGLQVEARGVLGGGQVEDVAELAAGGLVGDPDHRLDPAVEVAVHHVGGAEPELVVAVVAEAQDPGVFQEPPHDRPDPDVLAQPGDAGAKRTDAADDQVDADAGLGRAVERVDDPLIHDGVGLELDQPRPARADVLDL